MTVQISILGLGQVGSSIGLALAAARDQITRVGNDHEAEVLKQAQKLNVVDRIAPTLPDAVGGADVVILALPVDEVRSTLQAIAPHLKPGVVVLDTSPATVQATRWAQELLTSPECYFLTFTPAANARYLGELDQGPASAHADLFKDNIIMITSAPGVDESAVQLAENLARLIGSTPIFSDPYEVDGLLSASHVLPGLIAAALVNVTAGMPGWNDGRKIANARFARIADLAAYPGGGKKPGEEALQNRENTLRALDNLIGELYEIREVLASGNETAFHERLERARQLHAAWFRQRTSGKWEEGAQGASLPSFGETLGRLFGIRPKGDQEKRNSNR